jgi:hypothetical protein
MSAHPETVLLQIAAPFFWASPVMGLETIKRYRNVTAFCGLFQEETSTACTIYFQGAKSVPVFGWGHQPGGIPEMPDSS